jgi:DNA-binding CsgD family transcriptional regulator
MAVPRMRLDVGREISGTGCIVSCGMPMLVPLLTAALLACGLSVDPAADLTLLLDAPYGFALRQFRATPAHACASVVLSDNPCPEYQDDLWDAGPAALLSGTRAVIEMTQALAAHAAGRRYRTPLAMTPRLTPRERQVLQGVVRGWSNDAIAARLCVEERTVRNTLTRVYAALGVTARQDLIRMYFGCPDLNTVPSAATDMHQNRDLGPLSYELSYR